MKLILHIGTIIKKYLIIIKLYYIIYILFLLYNLKFQIFSNNKRFFKEEEKDYIKYSLLKSKPVENNNSLIIKEKKDILNKISKDIRKNLKFINKIFIITNIRFGNAISLLNKFIFYCEIIGCKSIILDKNIYSLIKNKIKIKTNNITIEVEDISKYKINSNDTLFYDASLFFYYFFNIKPEIRFHLLRDEILQNLPKVNCFDKDLYIHIRSGDIFTSNIISCYSQPPLCFYRILIESFEFHNIYIISLDKENPVIKKLINQSSHIIYQKNSFLKDISILINAYNVVCSISSFLVTILQINYNLIKLFDYNLYKLDQKYKHFHYDLYKYYNRNFTIYRMEPSPNYLKVMQNWKNSKIQRKLMVKEKCINFFRIIINK